MRENENIIKPLSVERIEFINCLKGLISSSNLPMFVMESVIKDLYNEIHVLSQEEYKRDITAYNDKLKRENEDKDNEETETF